MDCLESYRTFEDYIKYSEGTTKSLPLLRLTILVYYQILCFLPNSLRSWFNTLKSQKKQFFDHITNRYFNRLMIEKEFNFIKNADRNQFGNIDIVYNKKIKEIRAVYSLKDINFGIKFTFSQNYPLTPVSIECFNKIDITDDRSRLWLKRLTIFFNKLVN